jgi:hypothetical protein
MVDAPDLPPAPDEPLDACQRCGGHLGWIDEAWACSSAGCTYCSDCNVELGGVCVNCSEMLRPRRRTQPIGR